MQSILETVLPIFGLVLCGYVVGRRGWMSEEAIKGLNTFVFYFAIPALLFRSMARGLGPVDLGIVGTYFTAVGATFLLALPLARFVFRTGVEVRGLLVMGSIYANTVMLGIPLVFAVMGDAGGVQLMLIITFHGVTMLPVFTLLMELCRGAGQGWRNLAVSTARALAINPIILALLSGIAFGQTGLVLPGAAERFLALLGAAAAPCALFALGASLTSFEVRGDLKETLAVVAMKLAVHPAATALFAFYVFDLPPLAAAVAILTAACPVGANVFIISRQYDIYLGRSASAVLISTAVSLVSLTFLLAILRPSL